MSVGVCVASEAGIALAVDSRRMVQVGSGEPLSVESEEARKLFLPEEGIAVATYGQAVIGARTIGGLMDEFEGPTEGGAIGFAKALGAWFADRLRHATKPRRGDFVKAAALKWPLGFVVAGFDAEIGNIYEVKVRAGDHQVVVPSFATDNPGVHPFGLKDGIERLLNGVDRTALRQAKVNLPPEDEEKLRLLSYDLAMPTQLPAALGLAQALVQVQFLSQEISYGTFASGGEVRVKGCGGQIRTATVSREGASWGPTVTLAEGPTALPLQTDAALDCERRSA